MRSALALATVLLLAGCLQSSPGPGSGTNLQNDGFTTLSMEVVDAGTKAKLAGVQIDITVASIGTYKKITDSSGLATLTIYPAPTCVLNLARAGYESGTVKVDCREDLAMRIPLSPDPDASAATQTARARIDWSPDYPDVNQTVSFEAKTESLGSRRVDSWDWTWGDASTSPAAGATPSHTYNSAGSFKVTARGHLSDGTTVSTAATLQIYAPTAPGNQSQPNNQTKPPPPPPQPPATPGKFQCAGETVMEPNDTFGTDDSVPRLAWAALKTGFRAVVVWSSEQPTTASLRYQVGNLPEVTLAESVPTKVHLFVVNELPVGQTFCFRPVVGGQAGPLHAMRLANAMNAYDPNAGPFGIYTVNLLALVNEGGDLSEVENGMTNFASRLWDATDGYVRAGATIVIDADYLHHNSGWVTCYIVRPNWPACNRVFDVIFTEDAAPQGAASTYRKGISNPDAAIWMNMHWQAVPGPISLDDPGAVLLHEVGHYAFNMDDLYGDPVVPDAQDCDFPQYSMSIMGGSRQMTEFDDALHPCTGQGPNYVPSWTLLRGEFPKIPERKQIDVGPIGTGGVHVLRTYHGL